MSSTTDTDTTTPAAFLAALDTLGDVAVTPYPSGSAPAGYAFDITCNGNVSRLDLTAASGSCVIVRGEVVTRKGARVVQYDAHHNRDADGRWTVTRWASYTHPWASGYTSVGETEVSGPARQAIAAAVAAALDEHRTYGAFLALLDAGEQYDRERALHTATTDAAKALVALREALEAAARA